MIRIVYYDIEDNKTRTKVSDLLEREGLERIQLSVFAGKTDQQHWAKRWKQLTQLHAGHCKPGDRIYSHTIDSDHFKNMSILGGGPDNAYILQETEVLFI